MYFSELLASCRRRWYVLLALLVLSAAVLWVAAGQVQPTYEARASVLLVPPENIEEPETNRYLELSSLADSVDVLARSMTSAETVQLLEESAPGAEHEVVTDQTTSAPILLVTATAKDKQAAAAMLQAVLARLPANMAELQDTIGIRPNHQITLVTVAEDPEPVANEKARLRVLAVLAAGMLLVSGLFVAALDGLLIRRRARTPDDEEEAPASPLDSAPRDLFKRRTNELGSARNRRTGN